ncbi:MAG: hypothetical protein LBB73_09085 [Dysgonamonadaceae bacterium]|jgi:hypothetical protein|nr:hypothetical protein [Dysgonamonadaceae bacterium]
MENTSYNSFRGRDVTYRVSARGLKARKSLVQGNALCWKVSPSPLSPNGAESVLFHLITPFQGLVICGAFVSQGVALR